MNLCGKQVFEFVLQCGVAFLIEIDRNGVGCGSQLHGKAVVGGVGLFFVRSFHLLLSGSRCGGSFSCSDFSCSTELTRCWTAMSCFTSCQISLALAAAASLSAWSLAHSACQSFIGKGSPYPASLRVAR